MRWIVFVVALAACGGTKKPAAPARFDGPRVGVDLGREALERDLEATVLENYQMLSLGNIEAWADGVASERPVAIFGVTPGDAVLGTEPAALALDRRLYADRGPRLLSKNLEVHLSADGSVGWVYDELSYRVEYLGREASIPVRSTALYLRDVERWVLVTEMLSYAVGADEITTMASAEALHRPKGFETSDEDVSDELLALIGQLHNGVGDETLAVPADALLLLPGPDRELRGPDILGDEPLARAFGQSATVAVRDHRVDVAPDERVAWLVTNLVVTTRVNGVALEIGLRGSYVFERGTESAWRIMQGHVAAPMLEHQLSARVFGPAEE